ncbi:NADH-quinone oxidoreductase subunit C [Siphonobacter sp. BAB-5385]|uniref:NADH-quinone oxidoreductase subunit C n=1 Tax=unclassified Siphonobacter TaxID=2635712 RepID=UPI000B9DD3B2|nr:MULTISPECIES: NADH-quinone oxidoreductase subunit C [unclassified Siphonobacter]OZI08634.1 NADH-quinone oxidoreductase subunit C [Siphonobacter sp. BAB-5385]PMD97112.1 NADH-quinone oxidoreductase subunit C [Siphonobacter sp. BAB-5405]
MLSNQEIADDLLAQYGDKIAGFEEHHEIMSVFTTVETAKPMIAYLYNHPTFKFQYLTDLAGIHYPDNTGGELSVVYHLHSWTHNHRIMIRIFVPIEAPDVPTIVDLHKSANWMEREAYDFFGINFVGHPNLIRILNIEEMDYFPMRKEFPLEDATRQDKIDALFGR